MIKKLKARERDDGFLEPATPSDIHWKINELVDAVNGILDYAPLEMAQKAEPADPYAEQRKCICKLCWFWNDDKADKVIGVLTGVFDEADKPFERNINQTLYKHCEPVKPDDDIIYKGE